MYVSVLGRGLGGALGVDGGVLPLATHTQQYCDPASLVQTVFGVTLLLLIKRIG